MNRTLLAVIGILAVLLGIFPSSGSAAAPAGFAAATASPALLPSASSSIYIPVLFGRAEPKSSFELIDAALQAGELDAETALIYQVYAITLDPRLPAIYRGVDKGDLESDALREAVRRWDSLSAQAQALLAPFLTPPAYEGSWADPATAWAVSGAGSPAASPAGTTSTYCWGDYPPFPCLSGR